jgi:prolyl oligopeptidase
MKTRLTLALSSALLLTSCAHQRMSEAEKTPAADATAAEMGEKAAQPAQSALRYPSFARTDTVDSYGSIVVPDPYRGLEDIESADTKAWIAAQNTLTQSVLAELPARAALKARMTELWNFERFGVPFTEGGRWFMTRNNGLQNQAVLYTMDAPGSELRTLLDPNTFSTDGTMALNGLSVSPNGKYLAYAVSSGGSDWQTWKIRDIATGSDLADEIPWSKFSGATWQADSTGFYYGAFDRPVGENALKAANTFQKIYYHALGAKTELLAFEQPSEPDRGSSYQITDDGTYIVNSISLGTDERNLIYIKKASVGANKSAPWIKLVDTFEAAYGLVGNNANTFYFLTSHGAPKYKLIAVDLNNPSPANWRTVIKESDATLQSVSLVGNSFVASYLRDAKTVVQRVSLDGASSTEIKLPGVGTAVGFGGKQAEMATYFSFVSYTNPSEIFKLDLKTNVVSSYKKPALKFNPQDFITDQVFYPSKDGTKIPMFITHKVGMPRTGATPTILYGYGGFNAPTLPGFSPAMLAWIEKGGIYAVANLRGGGEYGEAWHQAGMKTNKQNVFDDFAAAADYLIAEGYTRPKKIAINGRSNGGLLVAATALQRPELFGAAIPAVGVLDMLRFNKFTIGKAWESDYGSPQTPAEFAAIYKYSPLHNIKTDVDYPPTLILTGDHDDRVYPAHSFKFAAQLQSSYQGSNPQLIRIETRGGHGAGKPTSMQIEENSDWVAFVANYVGLE